MKRISVNLTTIINLSVNFNNVFQGSDANDNEELNQDEFQMEDVPNMHQQQQLEQPVVKKNNKVDIIGLEGVTPDKFTYSWRNQCTL